MKHRIAACIAGCALALSATAFASAQPAPVAAQRSATLVVTGSAALTRAPDRATISFRIATSNDQAAAATSANAAIANALQKRLAALMIPATAITTSGYGLSYTPRPPKPDPASAQRFGTTVDRTIEVVIDNVDGAGAVVDAGIAAGVTDVNTITFALRDQHAAIRSAQTAALDDAVAQAQALATAADVRLVRIVRIAPDGSAPPVRPLGRVFAAATNVPTTIDPGNLTVTANVTLEYEIAPIR